MRDEIELLRKRVKEAEEWAKTGREDRATLHELLRLGEERTTQLLATLADTRDAWMADHRVHNEVVRDLDKFKERWTELKLQVETMGESLVWDDACRHLLVIIEELESGIVYE